MRLSRACPNCGGDLFVEDDDCDPHKSVLKCLQCRRTAGGRDFDVLLQEYTKQRKEVTNARNRITGRDVTGRR